MWILSIGCIWSSPQAASKTHLQRTSVEETTQKALSSVGYGYCPELVVKYMTEVKLAAASYFRRATPLPSGRRIAVQNPMQWAVCDLSRTICSPCLHWLWNPSGYLLWIVKMYPLTAFCVYQQFQSCPSLLGGSTWLGCCTSQCTSLSDAALITRDQW